MPEPKIIDRIRKLLALSKSSNEHEAAAAAARAAELMAQHQLSEAALCEVELEPVDAHSIDESGKCVSWKGTLANGCARAFCCRMFWNRAEHWDTKRHRWKQTVRTMVVGRENDVAGVRYMYQYLVKEVARLADEAWKEKTRYVSLRSWKNSFRLGCSARIQKRLIDQRKATLGQAAEDESNSQALMRLDEMEAAVNAFCDQLNLQAGSAPRCRESGYSDGVRAGDSVSLGGGRGQLGTPATQLSKGE